MRTKIASACSFILVLLASTITVTQAKNLKEVEITDEFPVERCVSPGFDTSCLGENCNQYLPLIVGRVWELDNDECDDCDELEEVTVSILDEEVMVDGQYTRVMEERERVDGEITEVSWNFLNQCSNTQDVYYWGEDVCVDEENEDAMDDPPYENHYDCETEEDMAYGPGAWRAGLGDPLATPGVLFPGGAFLLGARYFQEGSFNAQDWATNEKMGLTADNPDGDDFEDCVLVLDRNLLEDPKSKEDGDEKIYCPDIGIVQDEDMELTSCTDGVTDCAQAP